MIRVFGQKDFNTCNTSGGVWVELTNPNEKEITEICQLCNLETDDLIAAMDLNEKNRIEILDNYTLIIVDTPIKNTEFDYRSMPIGIILTGRTIITICSTENQILNKFHEIYGNRYDRNHNIEFVYEILARTTSAYQIALLQINKSREELEQKVMTITGEMELISLHKLESTLVHFFTSIKGNATVITKMIRYKEIRKISDEHDFLDNILIESQQNLEMAQVYREIINSTRELFSIIIDSRLNNIMKRLTSITVILSIPTIISGIYGMNLNSIGMPFSQIANGFTILLCIIVSICLFATIFLKLKKFL